MNLTRLFPASPLEIDLELDGARDRLAELYEPASEHWLRLNLITSVSGVAVGSDGTSDTLTNRADRLILGVIRRSADVVLVGAASVRAEGYRMPKSARLAIVTWSGDLAGHRIAADDSAASHQREPVIVFCPESAREAVVASFAPAEVEIVVVAPGGDASTDSQLDVSAILDELRSRGLSRIVCEGGPTLAAQVMDTGTVDEICLSTSPLAVGPGAPLFGMADLIERRLSLSQLLLDDRSALYARWSVSAS